MCNCVQVMFVFVVCSRVVLSVSEVLGFDFNLRVQGGKRKQIVLKQLALSRTSFSTGVAWEPIDPGVNVRVIAQQTAGLRDCYIQGIAAGCPPHQCQTGRCIDHSEPIEVQCRDKLSFLLCSTQVEVWHSPRYAINGHSLLRGSAFQDQLTMVPKQIDPPCLSDVGMFRG